jgi:hypothetical protein
MSEHTEQAAATSAVPPPPPPTAPPVDEDDVRDASVSDGVNHSSVSAPCGDTVVDASTPTSNEAARPCLPQAASAGTVHADSATTLPNESAFSGVPPPPHTGFASAADSAIPPPPQVPRPSHPVPCPGLGCPCDSFDGRSHSHCCVECKEGSVCTERRHCLPAADGGAGATDSFSSAPQAPPTSFANPPDPYTAAYPPAASSPYPVSPSMPPPPPQQYQHPLSGPVSVPCPRPGCPCDSFDGRPQTFCCLECREGVLCNSRRHVFGPPTDPHSAASPSVVMRPASSVPCPGLGCPCDSFDGRPHSHCCVECKEGSVCTERRHCFPAGDSGAGTADSFSSAPQAPPTSFATPPDPYTAAYPPSASASYPIAPSMPPPPPQQYPRQLSGPVSVPCPRPGCPCDSFDGRSHVHCCLLCKEGFPCTTRTHVLPAAVQPPGGYSGSSIPVAAQQTFAPPPPPAGPPPPPPSMPPLDAAQLDSNGNPPLQPGQWAPNMQPVFAPSTGPQQTQSWQTQQPQQPPVSGQLAASSAVRCARAGCPCDSFNGNPNEYCCRSCRQVQGCRSRVHVYTAAAAVAPQHIPAPPTYGGGYMPAVTCNTPYCPCDAYDGRPGSYCSQQCMQYRQPCSSRLHVFSGQPAPPQLLHTAQQPPQQQQQQQQQYAYQQQPHQQQQSFYGGGMAPMPQPPPA